MKREIISTDQAPAAIGPYSQAVRCSGDFVFLSGQIPLTPAGDLIEGGIEDQTRQVIANMKAVLAAAGLTTMNLVKVNIYLKTMDDFAAVNALYAEMFDGDPPARAAVAVATLPKNVDVEIEGVAVC